MEQEENGWGCVTDPHRCPGDGAWMQRVRYTKNTYKKEGVQTPKRVHKTRAWRMSTQWAILCSESSFCVCGFLLLGGPFTSLYQSLSHKSYQSLLVVRVSGCFFSINHEETSTLWDLLVSKSDMTVLEYMIHVIHLLVQYFGCVTVVHLRRLLEYFVFPGMGWI